MMRMALAALLAATPATWGLADSPAWASESWCQGDARNLERDLIYNGDKLPANDRLLMERRLNDAERRCTTNSPSARSDLEELRRDMLLQAERPRIPPTGGGSWTESRKPGWD